MSIAESPVADGDTSPGGPTDTRAIAPKPWYQRWLATSGSWVFLLNIVLIVLFTALSRDQVFWSVANAQNLMLGGTQALLLALGLAMLLGAGFIDLSVGANLVLSSVAGAGVVSAVAASGDIALAIALGFATCLLTGLVYGLINGLIVAYVDVNSLIVTLATLGIGTGLALLLTGGSDIGGMPTQLQTGFGLLTVLGIPLPAIIAVAAALVLAAVLRWSRFGLHTLAIGSARTSAERAGLKVKPHLVKLALMSGGLAGLAGFIDLARFGATAINGHTQDGLAALTAVVIGGTALAGGKVSIAGTVWGAVLAIVLQGGLVVIGVATFWQVIVIGIVLLLAVSIDRIRSRRNPSR